MPLDIAQLQWCHWYEVKNLNYIRVLTSLVVSNETVTIQCAQNTANYQSHNPNMKDVTKHSAIGLQKRKFLLPIGPSASGSFNSNHTDLILHHRSLCLVRIQQTSSSSVINCIDFPCPDSALILCKLLKTKGFGKYQALLLKINWISQVHGISD